MSRYGKIFKHIRVDDVKKKHRDNIVAEKIKIQKVENVIAEVEKKESNWRADLSERMTTGGVMANTTKVSSDSDGDIETATIDTAVDASFSDGGGVSKFQGAAISSGGTGYGGIGGFDIGNHLAIRDTGGARWATLAPVDSRVMDTMIVNAIRGNDENGGEDPDIVGQEELRIKWYDSENSEWRFLNIDASGTDTGITNIVIPCGKTADGLKDWTITIPSYARNKDQRFMLYQINNSGWNYDHYGVKKITYSRRTPLSVVASLDDPAASAFVRLGQGSAMTSPEKRKKRLEDMLDASKSYTDSQFGVDFPGSGTVLDSVLQASPIGADEVKKAFADADPSIASDTPDMLARDSKTSQELIKDIPLPDRKDFKSSRDFEKAHTAYHDKVFDIIMEKHDPLNNPTFIANTDYTPNEAQEKLIRTYNSPQLTARTFRQNKYLYQNPAKGYIDIMTGKTVKYYPPVDKPSRRWDLDTKVYPGAPEASQTDHRGPKPSFYWNPTVNDAMSFLYRRGPEGLVYKNAKDIGNPDKGIDPKRFLKNFLRSTGNIKQGNGPLSPMEYLNYHRQFSVPSVGEKGRLSPTGTHRPGENRFQTYKKLIQDALKENGMKDPFPSEEDNYSDPAPPFKEGETGMDVYKRTHPLIRAKQGDADFEAAEKYYKQAWKKHGHKWKNESHGYKITSKDKNGMVKTAVMRKPRTYTNDRAERRRKVDAALAYHRDQGRKSGNPGVFSLHRVGTRESYGYEDIEIVETTYDKIKKVRKDWNYKGKPSPKGEPDDPPPELDSKTGQHPQHGQHAARYKKLDPQSAESMPPTGNPEIDALVDKQKNKKEKARKVRNIIGQQAKGASKK